MKVILASLALIVGIGIGLLIGWYSFPEVRIVKVKEELPVLKNSVNEATEACKARQGIPIYSSWDGRLVKCEGMK